MKIQAPTNCPSCNSVLEWTNQQLFCRNPSCGSQAAKKLEHFAKALKIKGLGPATLRKLEISTIAELYLLTKDEIASAISSDKIADKLYFELENSKKAPLNSLLPAFSIPLIGRSASEKLSTVCKSINDIRDETCRQAGLGPKATENLLNWLETEFDETLPLNFNFVITERKGTKGVVCISGRLKSFKTKTLAAASLRDAGYEVANSVTKQVTILINESGIESAKTRKARDSGITIVTNLLELIGE